MDKAEKNLHTGHRERLREEFLRAGAENFYDHKLLELFLYSFIPRKDTNPIAHRLLERFGSLKKIISADISELIKIKDMTKNAAVALKTVFEINRRTAFEKDENSKSINNYKEAEEICRFELMHKKKEELLLICLDAKNRLLSKKIISSGGLNFAAANSRMVVEEALKEPTRKVIISHNHPSGECTPSSQDYDFTYNCALALAYVDIMLLDHIIVTVKNSYSFKNEDFIKNTILEKKDNISPKLVAEVKDSLW